MTQIRSVPRRTLRGANIAAFASFAVVAVFLGALSIDPRFGTEWWIAGLLAIAGLVTLAVRARHPLLALCGASALALISLAIGTGAECLLVLLVLYGATVRLSPVAAWIGFVGTTLFGALGAWIFASRLATGPSLWGSPPLTARDGLLDWAVICAIFVVSILVVTLIGTSVGQRRRYVDALIERAEQLARERDQQALLASARERERIAREMHDVIAHSVSVMIAIADGAYAAADQRPAEAKRAIGRVAETGRRTLGEVRRLLGSVRDEEGEVDGMHAPQPNATQLNALVEEFLDAGLPVWCTVSGPPSPDPAVGLTVYRLVQESLTNVLRHASAVERVTVTVAWAAQSVLITVRDSGSVTVPAGQAGRGILGMRERVALFDGSIEAGPHCDNGWQVTACLQWEDS